MKRQEHVGISDHFDNYIPPFLFINSSGDLSRDLLKQDLAGPLLRSCDYFDGSRIARNVATTVRTLFISMKPALTLEEHWLYT